MVLLATLSYWTQPDCSRLGLQSIGFIAGSLVQNVLEGCLCLVYFVFALTIDVCCSFFLVAFFAIWTGLSLERMIGVVFLCLW